MVSACGWPAGAAAAITLARAGTPVLLVDKATDDRVDEESWRLHHGRASVVLLEAASPEDLTSWLDRDTLLVATDFGEGTLTVTAGGSGAIVGGGGSSVTLTGTVAQIKKVLQIADEVAPVPIIVQVEGGKAGGRGSMG